MEQRWSLRTAVTFEVQVSHKCYPVVRGRSRNISLEGLFIETGIVILPVGCCIDVEFALMTGDDRERVRMPAVVVHRAVDGCGIVFHAFNSKVFRSIEHMLYTHNNRFGGSSRTSRSFGAAAAAGWPCSA
jgi:PilZ domain